MKVKSRKGKTYQSVANYEKYASNDEKVCSEPAEPAESEHCREGFITEFTRRAK